MLFVVDYKEEKVKQNGSGQKIITINRVLLEGYVIINIHREMNKTKLLFIFIYSLYPPM